MPAVSKSYKNHEDPIVDYCTKLTIKQHPLQTELQELTLKTAPMAGMLGAPEILTLGENFIHLLDGKKILDIGTYTGASALAWSLAVGDGGKVYTFDISHENYKKFGVPVISKDEAVFKRIIPVEAPALESLDHLIAEGHAGTFDFAFIDADKENYPNYFDRAVTLLKKGGVIMIDNALWSGSVVRDPSTFDNSTKSIDATNKKIFDDDRTFSALLNSGDGVHIAFKK
ncbi:O-methyltransferase [Oesophagostomum dentatum]|uniref:O-methyltransferase n=1 Tax=Oesophagostomum dentatum TaxID=61180 RepID=A0A0B1TPF0_OESDE|nr:O-methyltransferase [Oesophagostomum dentatum]